MKLSYLLSITNMQRVKHKKWRRETPGIHRTYGEKRNRNNYWIQEIKEKR